MASHFLAFPEPLVPYSEPESEPLDSIPEPGSTVWYLRIVQHDYAKSVVPHRREHRRKYREAEEINTADHVPGRWIREFSFSTSTGSI
jgi:hypothetical protein